MMILNTGFGMHILLVCIYYCKVPADIPWTALGNFTYGSEGQLAASTSFMLNVSLHYISVNYPICLILFISIAENI